MHRAVNFYIGALLITVVGAIATQLIVRTASEAEAVGYPDEYAIPGVP